MTLYLLKMFDLFMRCEVEIEVTYIRHFDLEIISFQISGQTQPNTDDAIWWSLQRWYYTRTCHKTIFYPKRELLTLLIWSVMCSLLLCWDYTLTTIELPYQILGILNTFYNHEMAILSIMCQFSGPLHQRVLIYSDLCLAFVFLYLRKH